MTVSPVNPLESNIIAEQIEYASVNEVEPVPPTSETTPARAVESTEERDATGQESADMAQFSSTGRELAKEVFQARMNRIANETAAARQADPAAAAREAVNNRSLRELLERFQNYDNTAARENFFRRLELYSAYGGGMPEPVQEEAPDENVRSGEDLALASLGIPPEGLATREIREGVSQAIERWFRGEGVFMPQMLGNVSPDSFWFTPQSPAAEAAERAADVFATYDRTRIATYLRETALLTPHDFMFSDSTGLGALSLADRRDFLTQTDRFLNRIGTDLRAAELTYSFNPNGTLNLAEIERENRLTDEALRRLDEAANTYYAALSASVQQYGVQIVSSAL